MRKSPYKSKGLKPEMLETPKTIQQVIQEQNAYKASNATDGTKKKGNRGWVRHNLLDVFNKEPGFRYRIASNDPRKVHQRLQEGWEVVSDLNSNSFQGDTGRINDGANLTSILEGHDYIVMRIPEELAKDRDEYFNNITDQRTKSMKRDLDTNMRNIGSKSVATHGSIKIARDITVIDD